MCIDSIGIRTEEHERNITEEKT